MARVGTTMNADADVAPVAAFEPSDLSRRILVSAACSALLVALRVAPTGEATTTLELGLVTTIVWWCGWPFFDRAIASLARRQVDGTALVALGTGAAYGYGVFAVRAGARFPSEMAAIATTVALAGATAAFRRGRATGAGWRRRVGSAP